MARNTWGRVKTSRDSIFPSTVPIPLLSSVIPLPFPMIPSFRTKMAPSTSQSLMNIEIMIRRYTMQTQLPKKSAQRHINIPPLPLQTIPMHHPKMPPLPFHFTLPPPRRSVNLTKAADDGMPAAVDEMDVDPASEEPTGQQRQ